MFAQEDPSTLGRGWIEIITHNDTRTAGPAGSQAFGEDVRPIKILESCLGIFLWRKNPLP